ncbi:MAG: hypothetical protein AAB114_02185, partial [Chloroflexota bacterium]
YTYDLFTRRYPEVVTASERISSGDAMETLLVRAVELAGGITERQVGKLFDWDEERLRRTIEHLAGGQRLARMQRGREAWLLLPGYA